MNSALDFHKSCTSPRVRGNVGVAAHLRESADGVASLLAVRGNVGVIAEVRGDGREQEPSGCLLASWRREGEARLVEGAEDALGLVGMKLGLEAHHAIRKRAAADEALVVVGAPAHALFAASHLTVSAADRLELRAGGALGEGEEKLFVVGITDPGHRSHLRIAELAGSHGGIDEGKLTECPRHAHLFACRPEPQADAPAQPMGARLGALPRPPLLAVELANLRQQLVGGRVDARGTDGNGMSERIDSRAPVWSPCF